MKEYFFNASKYTNQKIGAIREQYGIVKYLLSVVQLLNVEPFAELSCDSREADIVIFVDKMSRLFWGIGDKIHSIQYPFLLREKNGFLISLFEGKVIDSQAIAVLLAILENEESMRRSIENMHDSFMDIMEDFEIIDDNDAQFYWRLLLYLLSFESGYLRYDHDENENRVDAVLHPVDHIDFFYSGNSTFKIGLPRRIFIWIFCSIT